MPDHAISEYTRCELFDHLHIAGVDWCGRLSEAEFLERVLTISKMGSTGSRASTIYGDVALHRGNFDDWGGMDWVSICL